MGLLKEKKIFLLITIICFILFSNEASAGFFSFGKKSSKSHSLNEIAFSSEEKSGILDEKEILPSASDKDESLQQKENSSEPVDSCECIENKECEKVKQVPDCIQRDCSKPSFEKNDRCEKNCEDIPPCEGECKDKICPPPIKEDPCCVPKNECKCPEKNNCPGQCEGSHPFFPPGENKPCPSFDLKDPCCEPKVPCKKRETNCAEEKTSCKTYSERMGCPEEKVIVIDPKIKAIVFGKDKEFFEKNNFEDATGVLLNGVEVPGDINVFSAQLDQKFIQKPITDTKILEIKKYIKDFFFEYNHPDVTVKISDRYLKDGVIRVVIVDKVQPKEAVCPECEPPCDPNCNIEPLCESDFDLYLKDCGKQDLSTPKFKSIILTKDEKFLEAGKFEKSQGVVLLGMDLPFDLDAFSRRIDRLFLSKPITETKLSELKNFIKTYFEKYAHPNISLTFFLDDIKDGRVKVLIKDCTPDYCSAEYQKTTVPCIRSIVLICNEEILKKQCFDDAKGIVISGPEVPGNKMSFIKRLENLFINKPLTKEAILNIKHEIILYYKNNHRPVIAVNVPPQNITRGILRLVVTEAVVSQINVTGNKYFSDEQFTKYISIKPCCPILEEDLIRDVNFLNRNPFRNVDIIYKPGDFPGTTDIDLHVREIRPVRGFYGADNTGLDLIGKERYMAGIHLGNLFWQSHVLSYQITKSFRPHGFEAHTLQYTIPLPWKHLIFMYGGYSRVHAEIPIFIKAKSKGLSGQGSFRYDIPLRPFNHCVHDLTFGFDFKRTNNSVEFARLSSTTTGHVNLTQFMMSYELTYDKGGLQIDALASLYFSPGRWISDQTNKIYKSFRGHSNNQYLYGRGSFKSLITLPRAWSLSLLIDMQYSNRNLLASEMFGIGGYNTVRGYDERIVNGDNGVVVSSELRTPSFGVFHNLCSRKFPDHLQFLGFVDYGKVWVNQRELVLPKSNYLFSVGPGLRYVIDPCLALRIDLGFPLHRKPIFLTEDYKIHFGLNVSF